MLSDGNSSGKSAGVQDGSATNGVLHELRDVSGFVELVLEGRLWVVSLAV